MRWMLLIVAAVSATGCQHIQLERRTLAQASTLTDIQYTQVLNNLAMFAENPDALPYFSSAITGQNNNQQSGEFTPSLGWDLLVNATTFRFDKVASAFRASRTSVQTWNTTSVLNPDELALMRFAYQKTHGCVSDEGDKKLRAYFEPRPELLEAMMPGWFGIGNHHDVPRCACYVGRYCDTYVWVEPGGEDYLTRLTLAILDLANAVPTGTNRISLDQRSARIKKDLEQAQAMADILDKLGDDTDPSVDTLKSILHDKVLKDLADAFEKPSTARATERWLETVPQEGAAGRAEVVTPAEEAPLIRARPMIVPNLIPPVVIPNPQ